MCNEDAKYKIVELLTRTKVVKREVQRICGENQYTDDLEQEITMILLEYDADKIVAMNQKGKLLNFIRVVIKRQYKSENSPFYLQYKKYNRYASEGDFDRMFNDNKED